MWCLQGKRYQQLFTAYFDFISLYKFLFYLRDRYVQPNARFIPDYHIQNNDKVAHTLCIIDYSPLFYFYYHFFFTSVESSAPVPGAYMERLRELMIQKLRIKTSH
uniref:CD037 protein n=1 Tax=Fopius arisanus TaxID=64838 RepID=A0A0C9RMZ4_9HYME